MSSLIEGYNYDIFISYRQKDNKGGRQGTTSSGAAQSREAGWVSEFVEALKTELESTFKEDISIYFDENPHDGLLETHDVDASLKEKLKCLIFIPVISRTFCDPKAFAWQHEFLSFIEQASSDKFGLKVTLPNGNVATRVLPVRIHELGPEDVQLCEEALGTALRGVDFIYKAPGVNRPLRFDEDHPKDNLNKTYYRDQINKVANAIDEILQGIHKHSADKEVKGSNEHPGKNKLKPGTKKSSFLLQKYRKLLFVALLVIACSGISFLIFRSVFITNTENTFTFLRLTILNNDSSLVNDAANFMESVNDKIDKIKAITRRPVFRDQYKDPEVPLNEIMRKVKSNYILEGNMRRDGKEIKIYIELTAVRKRNVILTLPIVYERNSSSAHAVKTVKAIANAMGVQIQPDEEQLIRLEPSSDPALNFIYTSANKDLKDAWDYYNYRDKLLDSVSFNKAIESYNKTIEKNPEFALGYAKRSIARSWGIFLEQLDSSCIEKCRLDFEKAIEIQGDFVESEIAQGFYYYYCRGQYDSAIYHFGKASELDPSNYQPLFYMSLVYRRQGEWEKCLALTRKVVKFEPKEALFLTNIGMTYMFFHNYDSAVLFQQKSIEMIPEWAAGYKNKFEGMTIISGTTTESKALVENAMRNTGDNMKKYRILIAMYEKKYNEAIMLSESSSNEDFDYEGEKYLTIAKLKDAINNRPEAFKYYDSARVAIIRNIKANPRNNRMHGALGLAYAGIGDKAKAMEEVEKAIMSSYLQNRMDESDMKVLQAQIFTLTGDYDNAFTTISYLINNPSFLSKKILFIDPVWKPLIDQPEYYKKIRKL